ncbi:MAG: class I SAM-dependent methyltransferase [Bacteroidales bacterium]
MFGIKTAILRRYARLHERFRHHPPPKPKGWLTEDEDALVPPRELWIGADDPISHYYRWVWEYLAYLTLLTDLRRDESVLELGCGHGRTARGLIGYLQAPGRYMGVDVDRRRLDDARQRITPYHPNFQFTWADVRNRHYNPAGITAGADYRFPFAERDFDVIYAASLFTHLLPDETRNYLREARRVLKRGGRCLFSFFVLDHYRGPGTSVSPLYDFAFALPGQPGVAVSNPDFPDNAVAYSSDLISAYARSAGFTVDRLLPGFWSDPPDRWVNEQDLVLLTARG